MQSATIGLHGTLGGHAAEAVEEHAAIYQAIRDGEPAEAAHFATVHLDKTLEDYQREIQRRVFGSEARGASGRWNRRPSARLRPGISGPSRG